MSSFSVLLLKVNLETFEMIINCGADDEPLHLVSANFAPHSASGTKSGSATTWWNLTSDFSHNNSNNDENILHRISY